MATKGENTVFYEKGELLATDFFKKLYQYTYGDDWYKIKGGSKPPEAYDIQGLLKFIVFETEIKDGPVYSIIRERSKDKYIRQDKIMSESRYDDYITNLHKCIRIRNTLHHKNEENHIRNELESSVYDFVACYTAVFEPFRNIEELLYDRQNRISYTDKLKELFAEYMMDSKVVSEVIKQLPEKYRKVYSEDDILAFSLNKGYAVYENNIKTNDSKRLLADVKSECERNYIRTAVSVFLGKNKKLLMIGAFVVVAVIASVGIYTVATHNPYLYVADDNVISSLDESADLQPYVWIAEYDPETNSIKMRIAVKNNTSETIEESPEITLELQVDDGQKYTSYHYEFRAKDCYSFSADATQYFDIIVNAADIKEPESGRSIAISSGNFSSIRFNCL